MTQLTFFGPEATPFILSLAVHLTLLDHCVMLVHVGPDHAPSPVEAAHLSGIRLGELRVHPGGFEQAVHAVISAGFGHTLVIWSWPAQPPRLWLTTERVETGRLPLQDLAVTLAQRIEQARRAGTGPLELTITDVPRVH